MLRLDRLTCGYGPVRAVTDVSLEVATGAVLSLIGANGAGKSSTLMAVAGHVAIMSGRVLFDGEDISAEPARARVGRGIALAPEGRRLFPDLTVQENLAVGGYSRSRKAEARNVERVLTLFPRLEGRLRQLAGSMSGGEQQMLAIGRALMAEPRLLMIDEVSLGLMPAVIDVCYAALGRLRDDGLAILLVEQSTQRAFEIADTVCVLESGRMVWSGAAEAAREDPALVEAYLGLAR